MEETGPRFASGMRHDKYIKHSLKHPWRASTRLNGSSVLGWGDPCCYNRLLIIHRGEMQCTELGFGLKGRIHGAYVCVWILLDRKKALR